MCSLQQLEQLVLEQFYSVSSQFTHLWLVPDEVPLYDGKEPPRKTQRKNFVLNVFVLFFVKESLKV